MSKKQKNVTVLRITPDNILTGDLIRVTVTNKDVKVSTVGRVARREHGRHYTEYLTAEGITLLERYSFEDAAPTVTLLDRLSWNNPGLFDVDEI